MNDNPLVWLNSLVKEFAENNPIVSGFIDRAGEIVGAILVPFLIFVGLACVIMTFVQRGPQIRGFGYYTHLLNPFSKHTPREVKLRRLLILSLGGTVGIGNMSGVSLGIEGAGPGVLFWMTVFGLLAAALKCASSTLAAYFQVPFGKDKAVSGPMQYMVATVPYVGVAIALVYAAVLIVAGLFGANAFQVNQASEAVEAVVERAGQDARLATTLLTLSFLVCVGSSLVAGYVAFGARRQLQSLGGRCKFGLHVGLVLLFVGIAAWCATDGARDFIASDTAPITMKSLFGVLLCAASTFFLFKGVDVVTRATNVVVPVMGALYLGACGYVMCCNLHNFLDAVQAIVYGAFNPAAFGWGAGLSLIAAASTGVLRALFSSEAGLGNAGFALGSVRTDQPVHSGLAAMPATFIDTNFICMTTGMTIVMSGVYADPDVIGQDNKLGIRLVLRALETELGPSAGVFMVIAAGLFAFSTVCAWSYYGDVATRDICKRLCGLFGRESAEETEDDDIDSSLAVKIHRGIYAAVVLLAALVELRSFMPVMDLAFVSLFIINVAVVLWNIPLLLRIYREYWARPQAS